LAVYDFLGTTRAISAVVKLFVVQLSDLLLKCFNSIENLLNDCGKLNIIVRNSAVSGKPSDATYHVEKFLCIKATESQQIVVIRPNVIYADDCIRITDECVVGTG